MIVTSFELSNTFWLIIKCNVWLGKYTKSEFICRGVGKGNIFLQSFHFYFSIKHTLAQKNSIILTSKKEINGKTNFQNFD